MSASEQELAQHFDGLSDDELLGRWRSGGLTELAQRVATAEVRRRGLDGDAPTAPAKPREEAAEPAGVPFSGWHTVFRSNNVLEAQVLRARLESEGIPVAAIDHHQIQTDTLLAIAMGGTRVQVPVEYAEQAADLLARIQSGELAEADEDASPAPAAAPAGEKPALWNPDMAAFLGWFFFSSAFAAAIHAVNWHSLGNKARMWTSVAWAVGTGALLLALLARYRTYSPLLPINTLLIVIWYFASGRSQSKYLTTVLHRSYKKRSWLVPVCVVAILFGLLLGSRFFTGLL
jgi:hypothetical protein